MKAAVYHGSRDIRVEEVSKPEIADNEMRVQVRTCGYGHQSVTQTRNLSSWTT